MTALLFALIRCVRSYLTLSLLRLAYRIQPAPQKPPPSERLYPVVARFDGVSFRASLPALGAAHLLCHDYRRRVYA